MLGSSQGLEALLGLHPVLIWQQGTEALVSQQQHCALCWQLGHKMVVPPGERPNAQFAGCAGVRLCCVQS